MKNIPITHSFAIKGLDDKFRYMILRELAANGVENLVLGFDMLEMIWNSDDPSSTLKKIRKEAADAGLKFVDSHSPFGPKIDLNCPVAELRKNLLDLHKNSLACCAECGVQTITIHSGNPRFIGFSLEEYRNNVYRSLDELLPVAEKYGVIINLENIWFPTNTPEELIGYIKHFNSPNLGLCYDAGHAHLMASPSENPENPVNVGWELLKMKAVWDNEVLEKMLPYIVSCHLHDNDGSRDFHLAPFNGTINWDRIMKLLAQAPNLRCIQNEVILPGCDVNSSIHDMCAAFDKLMDIFNGAGQ